MSNEKNSFDTFVKSRTLYRAFISVDETNKYEPNTDCDVYAVSETDALEYLINEDDFTVQFHSNVIYEIPATLRKKIEKDNRQRLLVQRKLRTGNINDRKNVRVIFAEIVIDDEDMKTIVQEIREEQPDSKYFRLSLKNKRFSINIKTSVL